MDEVEIKRALVESIIALWPNGENVNAEELYQCTILELVHVLENSAKSKMETY